MTQQQVLQQAKDRAARKYGFPDWDDFVTASSRAELLSSKIHLVFNEAMLDYSQSSLSPQRLDAAWAKLIEFIDNHTNWSLQISNDLKGKINELSLSCESPKRFSVEEARLIWNYAGNFFDEKGDRMNFDKFIQSLSKESSGGHPIYDELSIIHDWICKKMESISQEEIDKDPMQLGRYRALKSVVEEIERISPPIKK